MRYVATDNNGQWLAMLGFGGAALSYRPRDEYDGRSLEQLYRRLAHIAINQRL